MISLFRGLNRVKFLSNCNTQCIYKFQKIGTSEGKPKRMRRLCLKTSEAAGRGGLGITSSSEEVYELML